MASFFPHLKDTLTFITDTFSSLLWLSLNPLRLKPRLSPLCCIFKYRESISTWMPLHCRHLDFLNLFMRNCYHKICYVYSRCPCLYFLFPLSRSCCPWEVYDCIHGSWCIFIADNRYLKLKYHNNHRTDFEFLNSSKPKGLTFWQLVCQQFLCIPPAM